jgi:DNA-binding NarL/FixJ family response regulator
MVAAAVTTVPELLEAYEREQPDVAVIDVRLPPTFTDEGIRGAVELRRARPGAPVLVLSQYVEERYARDLLNDKAEGIGYLLKDRVADVRGVRRRASTCRSRGAVFDPEVVRQLLVRHRSIDELTGREREVMQLVAEGHSNGPSRASSSSPSVRSRSTSAESFRSCTSRPTTIITAVCSPSSPG